jgi:hypothetical protein
MMIADNYIKCKLVLKPWSRKNGEKGESYCFTNRIPQKSGTIGGHAYSVSYLTGKPDASDNEGAVFSWLNDMIEAQYEAYCEEHTDTAWYSIKDDKMITNADFLALGLADSAQPQASF